VSLDCDVAVIDDTAVVVEDDLQARAVYCPQFQIPCPVVTFTLLDDLVFGAAFRIEFSTDIATTERYRQREEVGGVPGPWSGFLQFLTDSGTAHTDERTFHELYGHRFSNKSAGSIWQYQILLRWNNAQDSELWPNCGSSVIRVQYPEKGQPPPPPPDYDYNVG